MYTLYVNSNKNDENVGLIYKTSKATASTFRDVLEHVRPEIHVSRIHILLKFTLMSLIIHFFFFVP